MRPLLQGRRKGSRQGSREPVTTSEAAAPAPAPARNRRRQTYENKEYFSSRSTGLPSPPIGIMAGKKAAGENSKKAQGQARKADAAAQKAAAEDAKKAAAEASQWEKGAKSNAKKEAEAAKKAEAARKKAEKDALMAEEEKSLPSRAAPKNAKTAPKKTRGLDLSQLDDDGGSKKLPGLVASNIDDALDALGLADSSAASDKIDRHPERRRKAAYAAFEERRLKEMDTDGSGAGLRLNQRKERIRKEFEKSPENPMNQLSVAYDASKEEIAQLKQAEKSKVEGRLAARD
ncbi:hypothetical protein B0T16DRAFT_459731 [Cercophora newfieldiana]|uniref:DUF1014-domain-containing protein n=1 Tax=Cercophora newfieldiana TaxID=92897 RepID=A0AA39Y094_9PEZI|nr:hypothetical protein B0T16DRAFT_459731 [Cercophora newfieldiana]